MSSTTSSRIQQHQPTAPSATILSLDHLVLTVSSIPATTAWYVTHLGMRAEEFTPPSLSANAPSPTRHALIFGSQKINLHESGKEFLPGAANVQRGSADLCFIAKEPVAEVRRRLVAGGVSMEDLGGAEDAEGTVKRTGARGVIRSVYCRDPDGNLIE